MVDVERRGDEFEFGEGEENLERVARGKGNWEFSLFGAELPLIIFSTAFSMLKHGLLHSSVVEA